MISFQNYCGIHRLQAVQVLTTDMASAWKFQYICPPHMKFHQKSAFQEIYPGQMIAYKIYPFKLLPAVSWITEITRLEEPDYFIDEQRFGPYSMWHHEHHFKSIDEKNTEMTDIIHYKLPLGPVGQAVNALVVQRQLREIFMYRQERLKEYFQ